MRVTPFFYCPGCQKLHIFYSYNAYGDSYCEGNAGTCGVNLTQYMFCGVTTYRDREG